MDMSDGQNVLQNPTSENTNQCYSKLSR
eukprot:UN14104